MGKRNTFTKALKVLLLFAAGLVGFSGSTHSQQIVYQTVTALGFGITKQIAIANSISNGVAQVNGEVIASSTKMKTLDFSSSGGDDLSMRKIEESIRRKTKGVVKNWRILKIGGEPQNFVVTTEVVVVKLKKSNQLLRLKLAVVPKTADSDKRETVLLTENLSHKLVTSRKFAILDRNNSIEIAKQLSWLRKSGSIEDQVRLGAEVAPDLLVVCSVRKASRSNRKIYAIAKIEVIDYTTRQVKFSEVKTFPLKRSDDFSNDRRISFLARGFLKAIISHVYPPVIVSLRENLITISQGKEFFSIGEKVEINEKAGKIKDPYTNEIIGQDFVTVAEGIITYVDSRISKASVKNGASLSLMGVAKRSYVVSAAKNQSPNSQISRPAHNAINTPEFGESDLFGSGESDLFGSKK
jgi:hypothetical protein